MSLALTRHQQIIEAVREDGSVSVSEIARKLGVSEMTVRRDLAELQSQGLVNRVHGGAVASASISFGARLVANAPEKAAAAEKLAQFLPAQGTIYLDGSTTMLHLVSSLKHAQGLQVTTNNVETFRRLSAMPGIEPLLIGGRLDRRTDNLVGALASRSLLSIAFDAAFFSCYGISAEHGPMEATVEDAEIKDMVASRSAAVYLAADTNKLGVIAAGVWNPERGKSTLATDIDPQDKRLAPFKKRFVSVL